MRLEVKWGRFDAAPWWHEEKRNWKNQANVKMAIRARSKAELKKERTRHVHLGVDRGEMA